MMDAQTTRLALGVAGVLAAVAAVAMDSRAAAWVAVVLLGAAVLIRLVAARRSRKAKNSEPD